MRWRSVRIVACARSCVLTLPLLFPLNLFSSRNLSPLAGGSLSPLPRPEGVNKSHYHLPAPPEAVSQLEKGPSFPRKRESMPDFIQDLNLWMPACAGMTNYDTISQGEGISFLILLCFPSPLVGEGRVRGNHFNFFTPSPLNFILQRFQADFP